MDIRYSVHPQQLKQLTTDQIREKFLIESLFTDSISLVYAHDDRVIVGGVAPRKPMKLEGSKKDLGTDYFLERREIGIINIGGPGTVTADGTVYRFDEKDGLYIGKGVRDVVFASEDAAKPAMFYFNSCPAHASYPTTKISISAATPTKLGSQAEANQRTINKYIHPDGVKSCQLVMGMTVLEPGSVWNTMPCHTHERRMEVYLYFGMEENGLVFHMMGQPSETRHIVMRNGQAVISPSWSIHSGVGTKSYTFIWGMAGENQTFSDMDAVAIPDLK